MADDKNKTLAIANMPTIPVAMIEFKQPTDVPGSKMPEQAIRTKSGENGKQTGYEIDYIPQLRHHRVTFVRGNQLEVRMYPEAMVSWVPMSEKELAEKAERERTTREAKEAAAKAAAAQ